MEKYVSRKLAILLIGSVMLLFMYVLFLPNVQLEHDIEITLHFSVILYLLLSTYALFKIDWKQIKKDDWILACILGLLSITIILPEEHGKLNFYIIGLNPTVVILANLILGITVTLSYLLSVSFASTYDIRKTVMRPLTAENIKIYLSIIITFIVIVWVLRGFKAPGGINLISVLTCISAGVSEEVIFRALPYSFSLNLGEGKDCSKTLTFLLMTVFFTLIHFIAPMYYYGFFTVLPRVFTTWFFAAVPITLLYLKRDLTTAISVHILWDILMEVFA